MDNIPAVGGESTWIRDLFERILAVGWALGSSFLRSPRRMADAPHSTPKRRRLVGLEVERQIRSTGSGAIYFDAVPELEVDPCAIIPLGPNSHPEIGSTLAPGLDQSPSSCSETLTKDSERFPEPEGNPILMHPLPVCASALTIPPGFEKTSSARTQRTYSDVVSQPDSNLRMPPKQVRGAACNPCLTHPLPVSASAVAISPGSPIDQCIEEQVLSSGSETIAFLEPEIIGDVIRLVRTAALVSGADVERGHQRIVSDFDLLSECEGIKDFIRRPRKAANASGTETDPKLERIAFQVSSDSSDFDVLSGSEESAKYYATRSTAGLPSAGAEAVSDLEQTESSLSSSDATNSDDLSKHDGKDLSAAKEVSDLERKESSLSSSHATDSDDLFKRDKDLSATVAANSSADVLVEAEMFKYKGKGGEDSQRVKFTFGSLNPNAKEFIPRAAGNSGVISLHSRQNLSDFREDLELTAEEFQRPPRIKVNEFSLFSSPSDSKLDLGTALRMNFQGGNKWTKWAPRSDSSPRSPSEVVWGSAGRKKPISSKSGLAVQDHVKVPSRSQSATSPWGWKDRRSQCHRPHHHPSSPVHTLKASSTKAPVAREPGHHISPRQDVRLQSRR